MAKSTRLCDVDGCERKHSARGLCAMHWKRQHGKRTMYPRTCVTCGADYQSGRPDGRFCDDDCKGLWYSENGIRPARRPSAVSKLPADHPVIELVRQSASQKSALREAYEAQDWAGVLRQIEMRAVKVDGCWLWPKGDTSGYGRVVIAKRTMGAHRLAAMAAQGKEIPSHMPVHHTCAEPLCVNPAHLQVITPAQNVAEMLERRHYQQRIAELENALASAAPNHPLLTGRISPAA